MVFHNMQKKTSDTSCLAAIEWEEEKHRIISVVGAGGKTTFIENMAKELAAKNKRVVITTTTHMFQPDDHFYECGTISHVSRGEIVYIGNACENHKFTIKNNRVISDFLKLADVILIEADGSKGKPLKVPADHEPVIIKETDLVIGILGFQSVGKPIDEVSHRIQDVSRFLKKDPKEKVTIDDLENISFHSEGLLKNVTCSYRIIWNCWDYQEIQWNKNKALILCEKD